MAAAAGEERQMLAQVPSGARRAQAVSGRLGFGALGRGRCVTRLKAAVHYTVGCLCEEVEEDKDVQFSKQSIAAISDITFRQCEIFAKDLEMFARHAKRTTVTTEDVKLLARRSNSLLKYITQKSEELASNNMEQKEKKKKKSSTAKGERTPGEQEAAGVQSLHLLKALGELLLAGSLQSSSLLLVPSQSRGQDCCVFLQHQLQQDRCHKLGVRWQTQEVIFIIHNGPIFCQYQGDGFPGLVNSQNTTSCRTEKILNRTIKVT
ncbi:hypothetical protein IHE44_0008013 [Lamprotornis superbus]|uniref:Centromere protein S n=1 Tax=Lamprotornis superbus TaxID=245042 RepID=A0A835NJL7_9PASS|nr:hypothetical protein IHE44_0008013 [Lamprotornis superbus]